MFEALLKALGTGLSIWESKEKSKYVDRLIAIKTQYREEYSKPDSERSDAILDDLEFQLRVLVDSFASQIGAAYSTPKS